MATLADHEKSQLCCASLFWYYFTDADLSTIPERLQREIFISQRHSLTCNRPRRLFAARAHLNLKLPDNPTMSLFESFIPLISISFEFAKPPDISEDFRLHQSGDDDRLKKELCQLIGKSRKTGSFKGRL
jgi:hypothetical protein